tara:strand:- start:108 stop:551 length:444 start_codon:yes stop_codon:yes gene_type:complete
MSIRKFADLANETDSKFNNLKDTKRRAKISDRFDDTTHNELAADEALQYLNKKVDECIDSVNTNTAKTGISTSQASAITANTAKTGITSTQASQITANNAKVSYDKNLSNTDDIDLKATVTENRGSYTLVFTITAGRITKTASISLE